VLYCCFIMVVSSGAMRFTGPRFELDRMEALSQRGRCLVSCDKYGRTPHLEESIARATDESFRIYSGLFLFLPYSSRDSDRSLVSQQPTLLSLIDTFVYSSSYNIHPITMHAHHLIALLSSAGAASAAPNVFKRDYFGPAVYTGPSQADIIYTSTVMVPGRNPGNKQSGFLTIWPGISNGTGDLIQSTVDSTQLTVEDCGATADQWCAMGSLFGNDANGNARQINGPMKAVSASDRIKIEYIRGAPKENGYEWDWTQMVTNEMTGEYISSLVSVSGSMRG
jgi:hypothetical protein